MDVVQIGSQFYVVRRNDEKDESKGFVVLDGPYPEKEQAVSMARLREIG